jgi:phosphatidylserine decarboxylase
VNFAREGYGFMAAAAVVAVIGFATAWMMRSYSLWLVAFLLAIVALWVAYFFRDPERTGARGDRVVVCPADGKVVQITQVDEPAFLHGQAVRVSIFMNVFDVHVNRYPVSGRVAYMHYNPGKFLNAAAEKSSLENEQSTTGIETDSRKVMVRQIAGLIARRIVTYPQLGDSVQQGDRLGIIRFGSRVDVFLPVGTTVDVKLGERVVAGTTVLAELP